MKPTLLLLAVLALSGCVRDSPAALEIPYHVPPAASLVATEADFPGFHADGPIQKTQPDPDGGRDAAHGTLVMNGSDAHRRVDFDVTAFVYYGNASAHSAWQRFARELGGEARHPPIGDEAVFVAEYSTHHAAERAILRQGAVVFFLSKFVTGGATDPFPLEDAARVVLDKLERAS